MNILKTALVGALITAAAFAAAQGRMMGMSMQTPDAFLVMNPDVQKDLKLTDKQKADVTKMMDEWRQNMPGRPGGGGGGGGQRTGGAGGAAFDPASFQAMMKEANDKIMGILDANQKERLFQIAVQTAGGRALFREDVQQKLTMKAAQKKQLNDLQQKMQEATMELFQSMRDQAITREEMQTSMANNNRILGEEAVKVLDAGQKEAFEKMKGPKFEGKIEMMGMGGRRGGGQRQGGQRQGGGSGGNQPPVL
jgi:hypothetical protein